MMILYETIRKILHLLTSTIWYLMEPSGFYVISTWLSKPWLCCLDGEVATLESPLIMAGPPGWSDCGPLATWAGNEWVVLSTLCYIIQHYNLIWQKLRGWIFIAQILYILPWQTLDFWSISCTDWSGACQETGFLCTQFILLLRVAVIMENILFWSFFSAT